MATGSTFLILLVLGLCRAELFVNNNYNKYGTNPYLGPVFNGTSPSATAQPADAPIAQNPEQISPQPVPLPNVPNVQQEVTGSVVINEVPPQAAVTAQPEENAIPQNPATNQDVPSPVQPVESHVQEPSSTVAPADLAKAQEVQSDSVPTVQPVLADNIIPQNPSVDPVPVNSVPVLQDPPNTQFGTVSPPNNNFNAPAPQQPFASGFYPVPPPVAPSNNNNAPVPQQPFGSSFYPVPPSAAPSNNYNTPVPQQQFGGSQASYPAPNFSNNPYLQGLIPGGSNLNVPSQNIVPPQNAQTPAVPSNVQINNNPYLQNPSNVPPSSSYVPPQNPAAPAPTGSSVNSNPNVQSSIPPQNAVPVPPVALPPQNAQTPVVPSNVQINNNPYLQNPNNVPPSNSYVPPQNPVAPAPTGSSVNLSNNPYLQNVGPSGGVQPVNPSNEVGNENSNAFFPSIPASSGVPQTPTQSYPTPCTNIPVQGTSYALPASQFATQGTTYQPQNFYPASTVAAKHLRARCMKARGQFPSDKCNYFVNCWDNDVREQPCPPGLAFSSKGYCDFEGNVDCSGLPMAAVPVTTKPEGEVLSPQAGVSYASQPNFVPPVSIPAPVQPEQPSKDPQPVTVSLVSQPTVAQPSPSSIATQSTPAPTIPSNPPTEAASPSPQPNSVSSAVTIPAVLPEQNSPSTVPPSSVSPTAVPVPSTTVDPALKAKCLKPRGQFPTEICNRYINCWDHVVREEECPKGMAFSEKGYCDFDYSVNCGNRTYDRKSYDATNCPAAHGTFRDRSDCGQYYTCMFGQVVARYGCPSGLSYNDVLGVCDYSEKVDCTHAPLVYPPTENHVVMQEIKEGAPNTSKCTPGSIYRLNPQCTSAVLCRYGFTEIVECPSGLAYDSVTDKCLLAHLAKC